MALCKQILNIADHAVAAYPKYHILPSMIIAQAYLESGNGTSEICVKSNNWFGLKWYDTDVTRHYDYAEYLTNEERNGELVTITDRFCTFTSELQSLECLYRWYTIYTKYNVLQNVLDYKESCRLVRECGYATDSGYSDKLIDIIERENLTRYDLKALVQSEAETSPHFVRVYAGSFLCEDNAKKHLAKIKKYVPKAFIKYIDRIGVYRIQVGAFLEPKNADNLVAGLAANGIESFKE